MPSLTFDFEDYESLDRFVAWFSNSGEQDYAMAAEITGDPNLAFSYSGPTIKAVRIEEDEDE